MRAGCDDGLEDNGDGTCVEDCPYGQVVDAGTGMCAQCGDDGEPICPDGMRSTLELTVGCRGVGILSPAEYLQVPGTSSARTHACRHMRR